MIPENEDRIALLDEATATAEERREAEDRQSRSSARWPDQVRALVALAEASPMVAWLLADSRPGLAWQALQEDSRGMLRVVGALSEAELDGLLVDGVTATIPASALDPATREVVGAQEGDLSVDRVTLLNPFPTHVLAISHEGRSTSFFAYPERMVAKSNGAALRAWRHATYRDWRVVTRGAITLRWSPRVPEAAAIDLAVSMDGYVGDLGAWAGFDATMEPPIDVLLYGSQAEADSLGVGSLSFALPEDRQVHQLVGSTRGHELAHVLLHAHWGEPGTTMIDEGVATWRNGDLDMRTKPAHVDARSLRRLADFDGSSAAYYSAALVCGWAEARLGVDGLKRMWASPDPITTLEKLVGTDDKGLADAINVWVSS